MFRDDLTRDDWIHIVVLSAFALYLSLSIPAMFRGRFLSGIMALAVWLGLFTALITGYAYRYELKAAGERVLAVVFPGTTLDTGPREVTVFRRPDGQFVVMGAIGKNKVPLILDTGASTVVLRAEDAVRLGIPTRRLTYDVEVSTANGRALTAQTTLPQLTVGAITEHNVEALVARPGALHENLLGMSFLNALESFTIANDRLILRGR